MAREAKQHAFSIPVNTTTGTNFTKHRPEYGELLIYDFYANGSATSVVRVTRVTKSFFYIDGDRKVNRFDGRVVGFETAIIRRDPEQAKKLHRQACERRLMNFSYETLPGKLLRELNRILDNHEVERAEMKRKYMLSLQDPGQNQNAFKGRDKTQGKSQKTARFNESSKTMPTKSMLEDAKPTWGKKHMRKSSDDFDD